MNLWIPRISLTTFYVIRFSKQLHRFNFDYVFPTNISNIIIPTGGKSVNTLEPLCKHMSKSSSDLPHKYNGHEYY